MFKPAPILRTPSGQLNETMKPGHVKQLAEQAFSALKIADENRRLECCLAIKTTIADKLGEKTPAPGVLWIPAPHCSMGNK